MFTFIEFLFGFLIARLVWDAVKHFAKKSGELPIVWFFKTAVLLVLVGAFVMFFGTLLIFAMKGWL